MFCIINWCEIRRPNMRELHTGRKFNGSYNPKIIKANRIKCLNEYNKKKEIDDNKINEFLKIIIKFNNISYLYNVFNVSTLCGYKITSFKNFNHVRF